jgi:poly-gamma-glutamate synthesis protein (capsule biosynthesis protein)
MALLFVSLPALEAQNKSQEFHLTLAGDAILVTPAQVRQDDPRFQGVVDAVRKGDAAVVNVEGTFAGREAYRAFETGSARVAMDPARLKDMQWMGFNLYSAANNHSVDYGIRGLLDTIDAFRQQNAVYAGIGATLGEARMPAYLTTPHGRVALISCASTFSDEAPAGSTWPGVRGRPGLAPLTFHTRYRVDSTTFDTLRKMNEDLQLDGSSGSQPQTLKMSFDSTKSGRLNGMKPLTFELSDKPGVTTTPDAKDVADISRSIREAHSMADYVVLYIHAHESAPDSIETPAQFLVDFAHAAVDAGVDTFAASGPHLMRGIEIYKGKPIFYSLGTFVQEVDLVLPKSQPVENYNRDDPAIRNREGGKGDPLTWESVVAEVIFRNGRLAEVILTPVELGFAEKRADRGYPKLADPATATSILEHLQKLSQPFGTHIVIKNGVGTITIENNISEKYGVTPSSRSKDLSSDVINHSRTSNSLIGDGS